VALQRTDMRMVRWMCGIKVQDKVPRKGLKERLGLDNTMSDYSKTGCNGMGMCCKKKTTIG